MKTRKLKKSDDSVVRIKPKAYYKMLVHILRYGSKALEQRQYNEVMGILIGHLKGEGEIKDVIVEDVVPISHGGSIEVRFAPNDYAKFSTIDERFTKKGWFSVGWYHSHPGLKIFFSSTDILNQLGWQTPMNPSNIGIVFDHEYLENPNDLGFRTFRLDDPSKGEASNYHEVKTIVDPPDSFDFYNKMIDLINCVHTKEPPIYELNEKIDFFGNISVPDNKFLFKQKPHLNAQLLLNSLQEGLYRIIETLINPITNSLNSWSDQLIENVININLSMKENIISIKNSLNEQINTIEDSIKENMNSQLDALNFNITDKIELIEENINRSNDKLINFKETLYHKMDITLENLTKENTLEFDTIFEMSKDNLKKVEELNSNLVSLIKNESEKLKELKESLGKVAQSILTESKHFQEGFDNKFKERMERLHGRIKKLQKQIQESSSLLVESLNPLRKKIDNLKTEKREINDKLIQSQKNNDKLQEKLNSLETKKNNVETENENLTKKVEKLKKENESLSKNLQKSQNSEEKNNE